MVVGERIRTNCLGHEEGYPRPDLSEFLETIVNEMNPKLKMGGFVGVSEASSVIGNLLDLSPIQIERFRETVRNNNVFDFHWGKKAGQRVCVVDEEQLQGLAAIGFTYAENCPSGETIKNWNPILDIIT